MVFYCPPCIVCTLLWLAVSEVTSTDPQCCSSYPYFVFFYVVAGLVCVYMQEVMKSHFWDQSVKHWGFPSSILGSLSLFLALWKRPYRDISTSRLEWVRRETPDNSCVSVFLEVTPQPQSQLQMMQLYSNLCETWSQNQSSQLLPNPWSSETGR